MTRQLRVAVVSGLLFLSSYAMVRSARAQSVPTKKPAQPVSDQMTNIPYFSLLDGMSSTLTLNNLAPTPTSVTVTIFNTEGRAHVLDTIALDAHSFKEIQLADVAPPDFSSGNIEAAFKGTSMMVTCQVSVFSLKNRVSFESREQDMMDFESANLAGILSLPKGANGFLAVTNVASNRVTFQLTAESLKQTVALFPRETHLFKLNDDESSPATTLVTLQHNGLPGDLITTGYVLNLNNGYSSGFAVLDPAINRSSTLAGAHFRVGEPDPSERFPEGTQFSSPLFLANVSAKPVVAHVSVDYTVKENQDSRSGNDDENKNSNETPKNTVAKVKDITIPPGAVQRVELSDALAGVGQIAEAGVDIAYDAAPGSVIGQLTSVDQSGEYTFEVPIKDPDAMNARIESIYPWTVENGTLTVLHLKNTTKETVEAGALISFATGTYQLGKLKLKPYQTIALDIQKLKVSQKPDILGRVFPSGATHGQLVWFQVTPYTVIGRAEDTDVAAGIARSFSCLTDCCGNYSDTFALVPYPMNGSVAGGAVFSATEDHWDCFGFELIWTGQQSKANSWTTDTPSVATVNSVGYTSFVGPGTAYITANFPITVYQWNPPDYQRCVGGGRNFGSSAPVNVNPPSHVKVVQDTQGFTACPAGSSALDVRQIHLQMVAVNNTVLNQSNYAVQESFSAQSANTCGNGNAAPATCHFSGPAFCSGCTTGEYSDTMSIVHDSGGGAFCSTTIPAATVAANCGYSLTSTWKMCSDGLTNGIWTYNGVTKSLNITVNNTQNYNDGTILY
jgi:hypothetical protein